MVDRQEALVKFIKQNYRIMLEPDLKEKLYKSEKLRYFSNNLKNVTSHTVLHIEAAI
jgi:hypothetical protein